MGKLTVYTNRVVVSDYVFGSQPEIEKRFEMRDKVSNTYYYKALLYNNQTRELVLPRSVSIPWLERIFDVYAEYIDDSVQYQTYPSNDPIMLKNPLRDEDQADTLKFLVGVDQYTYTKHHSQLMVALGTGKGKTYLGIAYIAYMNMRSIIITTSSNWLDQWNDRILEHTDLSSRQLLKIQGSDGIEQLLLKTSEELERYRIYTVTHATLLSYANNNGWDSLRTLFTHLGIGVRIYDEAHMNFDNIYKIDYAVSVRKTLYLTATPERGDEREDRIYQEYFAAVPVFTAFNPDKDPHTHYRAFKYKSGINAFEAGKCINKYGFNKMKYCDILLKKKNFEMISRVVMDFISKIPGKKLIFLSTNNAIVMFYKWITANYPEYGGDVDIFTSINENKEAALEKTIILTTSKSAGAAMDIPNLMVTVNLAEPTKSPPQNKQRLGRTRAYNSYYIDVVDVSLKVTNNYYIQSLPMFDTNSLSVQELEFNEENLPRTVEEINIHRYMNGYLPAVKSLIDRQDDWYIKIPLDYKI